MYAMQTDGDKLIEFWTQTFAYQRFKGTFTQILLRLSKCLLDSTDLRANNFLQKVYDYFHWAQIFLSF